MLRILSLVFAIVIVVGLTIVITGYFSSPVYQDKIVFDINSSPEVVWRELVNVREANIKKGDVATVEVVDTFGSLVAWQENLTNGGFRKYRMTHRIENRNLVMELTDSSYGLTGTWYFVLEPTSTGTQISITEESELLDPKIRGYRFFAGRNHDLLVWIKYIKVGVIERLLTTP